MSTTAAVDPAVNAVITASGVPRRISYDRPFGPSCRGRSYFVTSPYGPSAKANRGLFDATPADQAHFESQVVATVTGMPEVGSQLTLSFQIEDVQSEVAAGNLAGATAGLVALRKMWLAQPNQFEHSDLEELKRLADAVRARRKDSVDAVLSDTFGYSAFRPGQQEIIEAVLAGLARGEAETGTVARYIADAMRHEADSAEVARACVTFAG